MTRAEMRDLPIEDLGPEWIGTVIEVDDGKGTTIGFRLGRYEKTAVDGEPQWRLFSDHPAWTIKLGTQAKLRIVPLTDTPAIHAPSSQPPPAARPDQPASAPLVTVPQGPQAPRNPGSWVTAPPPR